MKLGYFKGQTKQDLINVILTSNGENTGGSNPDGTLSYLELGKHPLMRKSKNELEHIAEPILNEIRKQFFVDYFKHMESEHQKTPLGGMAWDDVAYHFYAAVEEFKLFTAEELADMFPSLLY